MVVVTFRGDRPKLAIFESGDLLTGKLTRGEREFSFRVRGDTLWKRFGEIDGFFYVPPIGDRVIWVEYV